MNSFNKYPRLAYAICIIGTIVLGLLSRKVTIVPLWVGDVLWATMVFYMVRFIFINWPLNKVIIASLLFCYAIEFSQLYQAGWINHIRQTLFGKLVLGSTFLWGDTLSYTVGVAIGVLSVRKV
ncbi:uncharacterized protein DUF2809 [Mucilaginibacter gracilis]|uniref:Uncharacterized protein DUF2809 n=1 Tax=Mucilaginibacter gracilis TaxID=423350 RepID=A0A495IXR2_9SPHI|nr:DUF2809 domain-containing protein [Mucilaginibacter gracilis]RKR81171.1 uncharacterized protein DUF2809 [Mucilaginibacter gracilis]